MRQVTIREFGDPSVMRIEDVSQPDIGAGEVLVDVIYAGLNPLDYKMRDGSSRMSKNMILPSSVGREVVGTIVAAAHDVDLAAHGLTEGTRVFGMREHGDLRGCYAERVSMKLDNLAPVPDVVTDDGLAYFAGLALAGLTAQAAVAEAQIKPGDTVLIHGGAGGVGQLLIPLAKEAGAAQVFATGRATNAERIRELGATPIPYDGVDWREAVNELTDDRGVDAVIDTHYFTTFLPSLDVLADGGRIVALPTLADLTPAKERGIDAAIPEIQPTRERLDRLAAAFVDGTLPLEVSAVLPLDEVQRAHELLEGGHTRGKLVLDVRS